LLVAITDTAATTSRIDLATTVASRAGRSLPAGSGRDGRRGWRLRTGEEVDMQRSRAGSPYAEPDSPRRVKAKIAASARGKKNIRLDHSRNFVRGNKMRQGGSGTVGP
jgi:hypothetical protein